MNDIKEGDLYGVLDIHGHTIELRYGYYEEIDRARGELIPIYPDFKKHPLYTREGYPLVTQMQEPCEHKDAPHADGYCFDCRYFKGCLDLIGICENGKNKLNNKRSRKERKKC